MSFPSRGRQSIWNFEQRSPTRSLSECTLLRRQCFLRPAVSTFLAASDRDRRAVELCEGEAATLVVGGLLLLEDADGDLLAQLERLAVVCPPVDAGEVAPHGDVGGHLVQLAADGQ